MFCKLNHHCECDGCGSCNKDKTKEDDKLLTLCEYCGCSISEGEKFYNFPEGEAVCTECLDEYITKFERICGVDDI